MKTYFLKKMNSEFTELIQGKAASKLIEQITIEELYLGTSLPVITGLCIFFTLTIYSLTLVYIFSILFSIHFLKC